MKTKVERKQIRKHFKSMYTHMKCFLKTVDQEELHGFRVQVKKLRALLVLLSQQEANHHLLRQFKPVRKIFKQAGNIREAYLNIKLANEYNFKNDGFTRQQYDVLKSSTRHFCLCKEKLLKDIKSSGKRITHGIRRLHNKKIIKFYHHKLNVIAKYLEQPQFDTTLHNCRKNIKLLLYNKKNNAITANDGLAVDVSYLDKLQELIGKWHDNILLIELVAHSEEVNKQVVVKLRRKNKTLQNHISMLVKQFTAKAMLPLNAVNIN